MDDSLERRRSCLGLFFEGGNLKRFDIPQTVMQRFVRWSPNGSATAFANRTDGDKEIWLQPFDGKRERQLTAFKAARTQAFYWSPDVS